MESNQGEKITFEVLQKRLLMLAMHRIQNGEYTERGLARILGVSQPQIHNVIKGVRKLHPALADRLLNKLGISALDLLTDTELIEALQPRNTASSRHQPSFSPDTSRQEISWTLSAAKKPASRSKYRQSGDHQRRATPA